MLSALLDALERLKPFASLERIGGPPAPEHIADALWLASQLRLIGPDAPQKSDAALVGSADGAPQQAELHFPSSNVADAADAEQTVPLVATRGSAATEGVLPLRTPGAAALPHRLALCRALRPLRRRVPSKFQFTLDEEATAEHTAVEGHWDLVLRPVGERWLDLAIIIDDGPSMQIWRATAQELRRLLERQGIARDVRSWRIDTGTRERVRLLAASQIGDERRAEEVSDVSGRRLVVIVSDCVSPAWWGSAIPNLVQRWAQHQPVSLVQMLPQRLWAQTALGATAVVPARAPRAASPSHVLAPMLRRKTRFGHSARQLATMAPLVTVTTLEPEFVRVWARFLGARAGSVGPTVRLGDLRAVEPTPQPSLPLEATEAVKQFQARASPLAHQLACLLAAAPLRLPVMRLVQRSMLPESDQVHLAEVFSSGLLRRDSTSGQDLEDALFDFQPGVRDALLDAGTFASHLEVQRRVSQFIASRFGQALDFNAYIANPDALAAAKTDAGARPFASVTASVLRRLGGKYRDAADQFLSSDNPELRTSDDHEARSVGGLLPKHSEGVVSGPASATIVTGVRWWRFIHKRYSDALGGGLEHSRFSDPASDRNGPRWQPLYLADSFRSCLQEIFLRNLANPVGSALPSVDEAALANYDCVEIETLRPVKVADLRGSAGIRSGVPISLGEEPSSELPWQVAEACFTHPENFEGIIYPSRLDESTTLLVLFEERARDALSIVHRRDLLPSHNELSTAFLELAAILEPLTSDIGRAYRANVYFELGNVTLLNGKLEDAERHYAASAEIFNALGDQRSIAKIYVKQGRLAHLRLQFVQAERLYQTAADIFERLGDQPLMASAYYHLGWVTSDQGRLEEAGEWYERGRTIFEKLHDARWTALTYSRLADIAQKQGRLDEAEKRYGEALTIQETLGLRPNVARTYYELGKIAEQRAQLDEAEAWYKRALAIFEAVEDRSWTIFVECRLGRLARERGQLEEAEGRYKKLGDHPERVMVDLGLTSQRRGELEDAENWYREALAFSEGLQSDEQPWLALIYYHLGTVARQRGGLEEAESWYRAILQIDEPRQEPGQLASTYYELGQTTHALGRFEEAVSWYEKAASIEEAGADPRRAALTYHHLGLVEAERGRLDEAEQWFRKALAIREELQDLPYMATGYGRLGVLAVQRNRPEEALAWMIRCVALFLPKFPHPMAGPAPDYLARLTAELGFPILEAAWQQATEDSLPFSVRSWIESRMLVLGRTGAPS
ncbi:SAV_2336 N-terminal domain-related protein [Microvirga sp.]|uniref:SAV_2336 N-terminal domain-related protein n=1 Tax=Microvirga sp. TaxID=1873136 RepID=UPI00391CF758